MMYIFFQTLFYYLVYLVSLFSIAGYGIIFKSLVFKHLKEESVFSLFFLGLPILLLISVINYILVGYLPVLNLIIIFSGFFYFFYKFSLSRNLLNSIIVPSVLFIGLLISKTHEDFGLYHYPHLSELISGGLKLGLGNLEHRYVYSSLYAYIQAIFYFPYLELKLLHIPVFLIYVSLIAYLIEKIGKTYETGLQTFLGFLTIFLILKFTRLSEFGYDYISHFLLIFLFIEFIISEKISFRHRYCKLIIHYIFAISVKVTSLFFLPIILYLILSGKFIQSFFKNLSLYKRFFISTIILLGLIVSNSFTKTGCIFYAFEITCISKNKISWSVPYETIKMTKDVAIQWTKGYSHQDPDKAIGSRELYLSNFNWIPNWIDKHFFYKINEFVLLLLFIYLLIYFFCTQKTNKININKENLMFLLFQTSGLCLWFIYLPQFRFGVSLIILSFYYLFWNFSFGIRIFDKKKFGYLLLVAVVFFNLKNINRIKNEFDRNDIYKFTNFPWYALPEREFINNSDFDGDTYNRPNDNISNCFNVPAICTFNTINIEKTGRVIKIKINK